MKQLVGIMLIAFKVSCLQYLDFPFKLNVAYSYLNFQGGQFKAMKHIANQITYRKQKANP